VSTFQDLLVARSRAEAPGTSSVGDRGSAAIAKVRIANLILARTGISAVTVQDRRAAGLSVSHHRANPRELGPRRGRSGGVALPGTHGNHGTGRMRHSDPGPTGRPRGSHAAVGYTFNGGEREWFALRRYGTFPVNCRPRGRRWPRPATSADHASSHPAANRLMGWVPVSLGTEARPQSWVIKTPADSIFAPAVRFPLLLGTLPLGTAASNRAGAFGPVF